MLTSNSTFFNVSLWVILWIISAKKTKINYLVKNKSNMLFFTSNCWLISVTQFSKYIMSITVWNNYHLWSQFSRSYNWSDINILGLIESIIFLCKTHTGISGRCRCKRCLILSFSISLFSSRSSLLEIKATWMSSTTKSSIFRDTILNCTLCQNIEILSLEFAFDIMVPLVLWMEYMMTCVCYTVVLDSISQWSTC